MYPDDRLQHPLRTPPRPNPLQHLRTNHPILIIHNQPPYIRHPRAPRILKLRLHEQSHQPRILRLPRQTRRSMQYPPIIPLEYIRRAIPPDKTVRANKNIIPKHKPLPRTRCRKAQRRLPRIVYRIIIHLAIIKLRRIIRAVPNIHPRPRIRYQPIILADIPPDHIVIPGAGPPILKDTIPAALVPVR